MSGEKPPPRLLAIVRASSWLKSFGSPVGNQAAPMFIMPQSRPKVSIVVHVVVDLSHIRPTMPTHVRIKRGAICVGVGIVLKTLCGIASGS